MPAPNANSDRRRRIISKTQGRRLDEAYLHRDIRDDMHEEAAAAATDPDALIRPDMIAQLHEYMAAMEGAGVAPAVLTTRATATTRAFFSTDAVVVVPGFLGSALSDVTPGGFGLIWFSPTLFVRNEFGALRLAAFDGNEADEDRDVRIEPTGTIPVIYDLLRIALEARRYTTASFAVDWRRDLEIAAKGLAERLTEMGASLNPRPVHLVAHSQGAMVARRALQILGASEARRIVAHLALVGPANFGSFSAPLAIAGDHESIALLRKLAFEPTAGFQGVFASMSGLYQLMPFDTARLPSLSDPAHAIGTVAFWRGRMPIDETRLAKFFAWAKTIDTTFFDDRTTVILGDNHGARTPAAVAFAATGHLVVTESFDGDGTVAHCNAVLPGVPAFLAANTEHSMLPTFRAVIDAVADVFADRTPSLRPMPSDPTAPEYHR